VHRLIAETTAAMDARRLNVAIARLMTLTTTLRKAIDSGPGPADPAVWEGAEALVRMLSCFAPFTAEEGWRRLGHEDSVSRTRWPDADPDLLTLDTVTCVVQVDGKVRDRLQVPAGIDEMRLRELALASPRIQQVLDADGTAVARVVVRPPTVVNVVTVR
jgi:leucyl-tRNA synthetase